MIGYGQDRDYATVRRACAARIRQYWAAMTDEELAESFNRLVAVSLAQGEHTTVSVTQSLFYATRELENRTRGLLTDPEVSK